jgi:hypothetical protein
MNGTAVSVGGFAVRCSTRKEPPTTRTNKWCHPGDAAVTTEQSEIVVVLAETRTNVVRDSLRAELNVSDRFRNCSAASARKNDDCVGLMLSSAIVAVRTAPTP